MDKFVVAVALATITGSPAFAQSYDPSAGSGNINAAPYRTDHTIQSGTPYDARALVGRFEPKAVIAPRFPKRSGGR